MQLKYAQSFQLKGLTTPCQGRETGRRVCLSCNTANSHNSASPVALLRASLFLAASADDRAEDLALGAVAVSLQQLDVAVDEDGLALLESSAVQRINKSTRPLANKRLASLATLLAHVRTRPATTASLQVRIAARLRARPGVHASNLARAVDLIRRALELIADELGAAGDGACAAVELLAGDGRAEEALLGAGVGEGRVPGVSGVVRGGEGALRGSRVGESGGGGREDGAEDEGGVHCVGELGVGANGDEEVGELAFGVGEKGRDGVLEGVVGSVNRVIGSLSL